MLRDPMIMPCRHTVCDLCVGKMTDRDSGQILCPTCNEIHHNSQLLPDLNCTKLFDALNKTHKIHEARVKEKEAQIECLTTTLKISIAACVALFGIFILMLQVSFSAHCATPHIIRSNQENTHAAKREDGGITLYETAAVKQWKKLTQQMIPCNDNYALRVLNNKIWFYCEDVGIVILDPEHQQQKTIPAGDMKYVYDAVSAGNDDVVVAAYEGLYMRQNNGKF